MASPMTRGSLAPAQGLVAGPGDVVAIGAGPGGMDVGAQILGLPYRIVGVDLDKDACATGRAAGFERVHCDMRDVNPAVHHDIEGAIITTPCPSISKAGLRKGLRDMQDVLDAITCFGAGCGCEWDDLPHRVKDKRSALIVETARWILTAPDLKWFVCEQVPAAEFAWEDLAAEAYSAGWEDVDVVTIRAEDLGLPSRRPRVFAIGRRYTSSRVTVPHGEYDLGMKHTMASVLGLPAGTSVVTRGDRRPTGGNAFPADGTSWCLTGSTRSWKLRAPDGSERELTAAEAGMLNGFPPDFPWQGSRTKQFLQVADVVNPVVAAIVLGAATNTPWQEPVRAYLDDLYGTLSNAATWREAAGSTRKATPARPGLVQGDLFDGWHVLDRLAA